jgi:hypothetical protein
MPVEGFDDASKKIKKNSVARRKAGRDASSKIRQAAATKREAKKAQKKAAEAEFRKYATAGQKRKAARNSSVNKADVIAKGKAAEAAKAKEKKSKADGNITKTVKRDADKKAAKTTKTSSSKVTGAIGSETRKNQYDALNWKYDDTIKAKPKVENKNGNTLVNAPGAYTKPSEFKRSVSTFTSAADRVKAKGVSSLKSTAPKDSAAPKKPRTSSDKAANRKYQKEMSAYNRQNQTLTKRKQAKRETEAMVTRAKGISATILGDDVRANKLVRKEAKIKGKIDKGNKKLAKGGIYQTQPGTYDFGAASMFEKFRPKGK